MEELNDPSRRLENEVRFSQFYLSGEPETTPNYPLLPYYAKMGVYSEDGGYSLYLHEDITDPGEMLIVENTNVSCACIRDCAPLFPSTHALTTVRSPPLHRISPAAHQHLAHKLAEVILALEAAGVFSHDHLTQSKFIEYIDARQHTPIVIPALNLHGGMSPGSSREKRGPWNQVEAGAEKTLDYESVWNIIANNAICFKVRSKNREEPSQVETCEFWGIWIMPSFMNHSCAPNCHAMRVGDAIIIRAARAIAAGEELTLPYFDIFQPLCKRQFAAQRWGFTCSCRRCAFESRIGKPYVDIQEEIVNLEEQIQKSSALKVEAPRRVTERLLQKLSDQLIPITDLVEQLESKEREEPSAEQDHFSEVYFRCICASFSEALIAWYGVTLLKAYEDPLPRNTVERTEKARRLGDLISCVGKILNVLTSVHQGSLFCQEFMPIIIKARNELIYEDLDDELKKHIGPLEAYVMLANEQARSYYGANVKIFESMKSRMTATEP